MTQHTPIYAGQYEDFHWAGFGSGSGTNLRECAKVIPPALIFSDRPQTSLLQLAELDDAHHVVLNGYQQCGSWKQAQGNPQAQAEYLRKSELFNQKIVRELKQFEEQAGYPLDLIVLGGYMRLVGEPLLEAYPDKIINVHPADLSLLTETHERKYTGEDAVYDAIKAGEISTRSSVIMVNNGIDHGEILTQGPAIVTWQEYLAGTNTEKAECLREYADAHQSFQKVRSDWPALTTALKLIAEGKLALGKAPEHHGEWKNIFLDDQKLPYAGFVIRK